MKQCKRLLLAVTAILLVTGVTPAQEGERLRTITVEGVGSVEAEPDTLIVEVGVSVVRESALEASRVARTQMRELYASLEAMGIDGDRIETTNLSIYAEQFPGRDGEDEREPRYRVHNMVRVESDRTDEAGPIIDTLIQNGANQLMGVRFAVKETTPFQESARREAIRDARRNAEIMAEELGLSLGPVIRVESGNNARNVPYQTLGLGGARDSTPVSPGNVTFTERVTVVYELQSR